jgi:DNA modification methylase
VGDATKKEDVARLMGGEKAICMWTDPPYGVKYIGKTKEALTIENDDAGGLYCLLFDAFTNAQFACVDSGHFYIAHPPGALSLTYGDVIRKLGWRLHQTLVWVKDSMVLGHADYHYRHEPIYYGYFPGDGRPGRGKHEGTLWVGNHSQTTIFEIPRPKRSESHPTMKPVALIEAQLVNSTPIEGSVLDLFLGSGSTLIACEKLDRKCYGMEIDPHYCDVIIKRWEDFTCKKAVKI